jgi:prepilin-type N-terminal cleavage/methylation domain-containing protein
MIKSTKLFSSSKGFTLLEILLVVGIIAILAGIVILAINPSKQLADTRNAQRRSDVISILNAVYQYEIDNNGTAPTDIPETGTCGAITTLISTSSSVSPSIGSVDLWTTLVSASSTYLTNIPRDPIVATSSGYGIVKSATTSRITVCAPLAENGVTISVVR